MDHSPWLVARMCSSISRMSSKEDVLVVPPCRCRYFYGLTKAVAHLAYLVFSDILPTEMDKKDEYGFACGWAAGYRSWLYRYGTLVDRKDKTFDLLHRQPRSSKSASMGLYSVSSVLDTISNFPFDLHGKRGSNIEFHSHSIRYV